MNHFAEFCAGFLGALVLNEIRKSLADLSTAIRWIMTKHIKDTWRDRD